MAIGLQGVFPDENTASRLSSRFLVRQMLISPDPALTAKHCRICWNIAISTGRIYFEANERRLWRTGRFHRSSCGENLMLEERL
jgi:hypothetical protein